MNNRFFPAFPARDGCLEVGERCLQFVRLLTAEQFRNRQPPNDSIGSHLRHCLDFLNCFLRGLESGVTRYDFRDRDPEISENPLKFEEALVTSLRKIRSLDPSRAHDSITVSLIANSAGDPLTCQSSIDRELAFLAGHTVHHLAVVQLLAELQGIHISSDLTTAFSTEFHRKEMAARGTESMDV